MKHHTRNTPDTRCPRCELICYSVRDEANQHAPPLNRHTLRLLTLFVGITKLIFGETVIQIIKQQGQYQVMQMEPGEYVLMDTLTGELLRSSGSHTELIRRMSELYWHEHGRGKPGRKNLRKGF